MSIIVLSNNVKLCIKQVQYFLSCENSYLFQIWFRIIVQEVREERTTIKQKGVNIVINISV